MAAPKFLRNVAGAIKEVIAAVVGTPDSIVATDGTGRIDVSFLPVGVGPEVLTMITSENITAGAWVNVYNNAGTITARNADATTNAKPAHGFVLASTTSPASATVYGSSQTNTALTGLTLGVQYFLSTTPGVGVATTPPSATGNLVQRLGIADKTTEIVFVPYIPIEIA